MLYVEKYDGYMADVPDIDFVRCDGTVFSYDELTSASMTAGHNMITITGGTGNFPLAYIDTDSTLEFQFESAQFKLDIFEMANGAHQEEGDFGMFETKRYDVETVDSKLVVNLPFEVKAGSVRIRGLTEDEAAEPAEGKFKVAITASTAQVSGATVITFNASDVTAGTTLRIGYQRRVIGASKVPVKTTSTTAKGELYAHWNIYSDGTNCADAAVKGILHLHIFRVRVTALPGFNSSYKSAANVGLTFAAMDPKRGNKAMYDLVYEPMDDQGNIVTKSSGTVAWDEQTI